MFLIIAAALALSASELPGTALPPIKEPGWGAWKDAGEEAKRQAVKAWNVLREHRPDRPYQTAADRREAEEAVDAAYKALDADKAATCAAGVELMRASQDDWERLMIATTVAQLGGEKGEPFLLWAMAKAMAVDHSFEPVYEIAGSLAARHRLEYLPAIFSVLRVHDASIPLRLHAWTIPMHECLFYVFARYGRDVVPYLYPMLEHQDPYVRRNAAIVLGYFLDERAKPTLLKMLASNDIGSGGAAFALGELGEREAAGPIARLLKNPDAPTRFWAAYALYEIGSKDSLADLTAAADQEKDEAARQEMTAAVELIRAGRSALPDSARKLDKEDLSKALDEADRANGLSGDVEGIAGSAGPNELERLEEIRRKAMGVPSDKGNLWFRRWTGAIKVVRRPLNNGQMTQSRQYQELHAGAYLWVAPRGQRK
jgi:hypothetical protein